MPKDSLKAKTFWVMVVVTVSKLFGFLRTAILAAIFGATWQMDAFTISTTVIGTLSSITGSLTTAIVPLRTQILAEEGREQADRYVSSLLNITLSITLIAGVACYPLAPWIVKLFAPKFSGETLRATITIVRIFLPLIAINGVLSIYTGVFNTHGQFVISNVISFVLNICWIGFPLLLAARWGVYSMVAGYLLGTLLQVFLRMPFIKKIYRYALVFDWKSPYLKKTLMMCMPIFVGIASSTINQAVDKALASGLVEGSISALNYGILLTGLVSGIIIGPIMMTTFTSLSQQVSGKNMDNVKALLVRACCVLSVILLPIAIYSLMFSHEIIRIVFERGAFDARASALTNSAFIFYMPGMVFNAFSSAAIHCFYAMQDTKTPIWISLISVCFNVILNLILVRFMQIAGLALATSVAALVGALILHIVLRRKIGALGYLVWLKDLVKIGAAVIPMAAIALLVQRYSPAGALITLIAAAALGLLAYVVVLIVLRQKDALHIKQILSGRIFKAEE